MENLSALEASRFPRTSSSRASERGRIGVFQPFKALGRSAMSCSIRTHGSRSFIRVSLSNPAIVVPFRFSVIVPTATEFLSVDGVGKVIRMMSILQEKKSWRGSLLGILPTFYDEQTRESKATMEDLRERFDTCVLPPIHRTTLLRECAAEGPWGVGGVIESFVPVAWSMR